MFLYIVYFYKEVLVIICMVYIFNIEHIVSPSQVLIFGDIIISTLICCYIDIMYIMYICEIK